MGGQLPTWQIPFTETPTPLALALGTPAKKKHRAKATPSATTRQLRIAKIMMNPTLFFATRRLGRHSSDGQLQSNLRQSFSRQGVARSPHDTTQLVSAAGCEVGC